MKDIIKIDAHQHFWKYNPQEFGWIAEDQLVLKKDFMPCDLRAEMKKSGYEYSIAIQARQSIEETRWLISLAEMNDSILGVVGWVDLRSEEVGDELARFAQHEVFKGVRHVVQDEPDESFMLHPDFLDGIGQLRKHKLVYEILIYARQIPQAIELASRFPRQRFVLDHIGKPAIRSGDIESWKAGMKKLAALPNVSVKVSGMITEADHEKWNASEFYPYLEWVWEHFGESRIMIGSDWPVCLLAGTYAQVTCLAEGFFDQFSMSVKRKVYGQNARRIYRL